jgi:hypothetical protein
MTPDRKFFFVHIMKTAGGTLRRHIRANFAEDEVYPLRGLDQDLHKANMMLSYLKALPAERLERIRAFTGHFPFMATELVGADVATITVLRDPVERTLSYLRAHRLHQRDGLALEEIYEKGFWFRSFIHNHQAKLFALTVEDNPRSYMDPLEVDAARLELAKANLAKVDVVGTQEDFDDLLAALRHRFGWNIGSVPDIHVNPGRDVPDSFRRRIAEDNAADVEFYAYAQELCAERRRARDGA